MITQNHVDLIVFQSLEIIFINTIKSIKVHRLSVIKSVAQINDGADTLFFKSRKKPNSKVPKMLQF